MKHILLIAAFGSLGALGRYGISTLAEWCFGKSTDTFAFGTLAANLLGCFLLGGVMEVVLHRESLTGDLRAALGVGFLGAFTTFSTFGLETFNYIEHGRWSLAAINVTANLLLGLLCVWAGVSAARVIGA